MVLNLPTPTISCGTTQVSVLVYAGKLIGGVQYPVIGADVKLKLGATLPYLPMPEVNLVTDIKGTAQTCISKFQYSEAYIKKSNEDFGSGRGNWHKIGSIVGGISPRTYSAQATSESIPTPSVCTGYIIADAPNFQTLLSGIVSAPTTLLIPVRLTGGKTSVPMRLLVNGREIERRSSGYYSFDLIRSLNTAGANINANNTILIESLATDCSITPATIQVPPLIPTGYIPPTSQLCSQFITTAESVSHPQEITDFNSTFYVYIRGLKQACKSDPTNPSLISKLPKGTLGTITFGKTTVSFNLTDDGIADIDLSKLINLKSII